MRTTQTEVRRAFTCLAAALGKDTKPWLTVAGQTQANVGAWYLDANPAYGGYVVCEMANESGGVYNPLGFMRMSGREFVWAVRFALDVLDIANRGGAHRAS